MANLPTDLGRISLNDEDMSLIRLFANQVNTLPKFKGGKGEQWRAFETTFAIKWDNSVLGDFPIDMEKRALVGCLEGQATRVHTLLTEGSDGWNTGATMEEFLVQVRNIFNPPEE